MNEQAAAPRFNSTGDVVRDTTTDLTWTAKDAIDKDVTHEEAVAAVEALNAEKFSGFDDWRLPTVDELFMLADRSRYDPAIDTDFFPTCKSDWYWTSTDDAASPSDYAWIVGFLYGFAFDGNRGDHNRVRAVRGPARQ